MSEWKETTIGNVAEVKTGPFGSALLNEQYIKGGTPVITVEHIKDFKICQLDYPSVSEGDKKRLGSYTLEEGDIVFSRVGSVDLSAIALKENEGWLFSSRMLRVRPNRNRIDPLFLSYYLRLHGVRTYINNIAVGSTMPSINTEILKSIPIHHCELEEQKEIAKTLSNLDKKITLLRQQNQDLEELAQTLFKRWFVEFEFPNENGEPYKSSGGKMEESELGEIPEGWKVGRFCEIIEFSNGYAFSSNELLDEPTQTTIDVFKMGHIMKGGGFNPSKSKSYVEKGNCQGLEKYMLKKGDLLMCMTDMKDNTSLLGHTALMPVNDKFIVNQRVGLIRAKNGLGIHYPYLYILTNNKTFLSEIRSRANSGVQVNLSTNGIKETQTLIATKEVNKAFDIVANRLFEKILTNQEEIQTLTQLRDTLLPKLMSGEIRLNYDF